MEKSDILIRALEPEIDMKCAEIKQKKSDKLMTEIFISIAAIMLVLPAILTFFGVGLFTVFVPVLFAGAALAAASPLLICKGAERYEQI